MENLFIEKLALNPIIAAVNDLNLLDEAIESSVEVIFLLTGTIFELKSIVDRIKSSEKMLFIHFDLMEGFSKDIMGLNYLLDNVKPDGIISTKNHLVRHAKKRGFFSIQRLFLLDSLNLQSGIHSIRSNNPDAVEILPGVMPKVTKMIVGQTQKPIITGGLIMDKEDVIISLNAGATGISSSCKEIWNM